MRILVTGAAGFIGSRLSERLVADGHEVVGLDAFTAVYARPYPRAMKERNLARLRDESRFSLVEADLRDADLAPVVADVDAVIHLAAVPGNLWDRFDEYVSVNLTGTQRLLQALRDAGELERRRFVQISTSSIYGVEALGDETTIPDPVSPYGITKLAAEQWARVFGATFGLPVVVLRYFSVYGPRQRPDAAYFLFIDALLRDQPITILGDGEQTRGNTYVDDVVEGTALALARGVPGEAYNIGGGEPISMNRALALLEEHTGRRAIRQYGPARLGDQRHTLADIAKARRDLGYSPRVDPAIGLLAQVDWQRQLLAAERAEPAIR